ncbi:methyltransferase domain-containing protein [Methyloceanibacter sp. wino2]|uniref:methyltransferase domain-containing protein n=1 Tax=Methyloceanibacter sp. wino2 TaxID=2170729 RepID=UPI00131F23F0|nr:methyltransferase domain-containing protein [Methyloceanibacter sp. wino2]
MSLNSPILSRRSAAIAARFGAKADVYEAHAGLQADVAAKLAKHLPDLKTPKVLELGCGTGLLSRHLVARYPEGEFHLTDAAPGMIGACRNNLDGAGANVSYEVMDAAAPIAYENLDLIVTSMMLHWLNGPVAVLTGLRRRLAPGGVLLFATLGPDSFAEWRTVLATEGLPSGTPYLPELPGVVEEEHLTPDKDSHSFLRRMQAVGGLHPRDGYDPLSPGALRRAIRATNIRFGGRVTWHIVYGRLERP